MKTARFWTYGAKGAVKLSIPYGASRTFQITEHTDYGAVILETNIIAFGLVDRLQWSWSRIELNRGHVTEWQGAYEAIIDRHFDRESPDWADVFKRRETHFNN